MSLLRVAVVGAGVAGLTSIKSCLEEGLDVVCYEKSKNIGGVWYYNEHEGSTRTSVMKCTLMNSSKEMSAFSDFPPTDDCPLFMPNEVAQKYLEDYAEHFGLKKFVKLEHEVTSLTQDASNGNWTLTLSFGGRIWDAKFDAVIVCAGHRNILSEPKISGLDSFKGNVTHSAHYRTNELFKNKDVLVVGLGSSAADVATDLSGVAKNVYLSRRRGTWISTRTVFGGYAYDSFWLNRFNLALMAILPNWFVNGLLKLYYNFFVCDPGAHGLKPYHVPLAHEPLITDSLTSLLFSKRLILKGDIDKVTERGVVFKSGEGVSIDAIVLCTGFTVDFPFIKDSALAQNIIDTRNNQIGLFKNMIPHTISSPSSLIFVGLLVALGSQWPPIELQSRYAARVVSGKCKLPSIEDMQADIIKTQKSLLKTYLVCKKNGTCLYQDYIAYMDWLANQIGCKPNLAKYLFMDFPLFRSLVFGACTGTQYRLEGPNSWEGARDTILDIRHREKCAFV